MILCVQRAEYGDPLTMRNVSSTSNLEAHNLS